MRSTLLVLFLFTSGCAVAVDPPPRGSATPSGTPSPSGEVTLAPGETKSLGATTIRFDRVESDSRCPSDVTCAWEGDAHLVFTLSAAGAQPAQVHLHTTRREATAMIYAGRSVTLLNVTPAPHSERKIAPNDYRATIAVGGALSQ